MPGFNYILVDVFTDRIFGGNQLAVFPNAAELDPALMQPIAREFNLSETTFVLPPKDSSHDVQVRIFTPARELPMAGHPTVGTAFVLANLDRAPLNGTVRFLEGVGVIPVDIQQDARGIKATMTQPLPEFREIRTNRQSIAEMLSLKSDDLLDLPIQVVTTGVPYTIIPIKTREAVGRIKVRIDLFEQLFSLDDASGLYVFTPETADPSANVHSRMFAPEFGIAEDPATGSAAGPLGAYLVRYGLAQPGFILNEQGVEMGRPSYITIGVERDGEEFTKITVGGYSQAVGTGTLFLPDAP